MCALHGSLLQSLRAKPSPGTEDWLHVPWQGFSQLGTLELLGRATVRGGRDGGLEHCAGVRFGDQEYCLVVFGCGPVTDPEPCC